MPYITKDRREKFNGDIENIVNKIQENGNAVGDINYIISKIIWKLFDNNRRYSNANELMGVLQGVQQEFYRRKVAVYEDEAIQKNGDIKSG